MYGYPVCLYERESRSTTEGPKMQTKSERFEMRLDQDTLDLVDGWRKYQDDLPSRSEAVRRLVDLALDRQVAGKPTLTNGDRLTAIMLCEVLKALQTAAPKFRSEINPDFVSNAIWSGHLWGLKWQYPGVFEGKEPEKTLITEVGRILDMWSAIEWGYERLSPSDKKKLLAREFAQVNRGVKFLGFDGNDETRHLSIANFLIDHLDRFTLFKGRDLNSHFPALDHYERMLAVFLPMQREMIGESLSEAKIHQILKAW
jgi:uncharacterized protein YfbU (UPF0304 family)